MRIALKPYLVYVPAQADGNPHFRGGDDLIVPINRVDNASLLDALMAILVADPAGIEQTELLQHATLAGSSSEVQSLLKVMVDAGVLWMPPEPGPHDFLWNYLSRFASDMSGFSQRLSTAKLACRSFIATHHHSIIVDSFDACGISISDDEASAEMTIVIGDFTSDAQLESVNEDMMRQGCPWMLIRLAGPAQLQVGPIFIPGETACYDCFRRRMEANRTYFSAYQDFKQSEQVFAPHGNWHPLHLTMAGQTSAFELVRYLLGVEASPLVGAVRTIDLLRGDQEDEQLLKLPGCKSCGAVHGG